MPQFAYCTYTNILITSALPDNWSTFTLLVPPTFDSKIESCFFRSGTWVVVKKAQIEKEASDKEASDKAKAELTAIDLASIRAIREYIAAKPDAPQILKDREAAAAIERAKVKP